MLQQVRIEPHIRAVTVLCQQARVEVHVDEPLQDLRHAILQPGGDVEVLLGRQRHRR
jgi:transcription elongation factor